MSSRFKWNSWYVVVSLLLLCVIVIPVTVSAALDNVFAGEVSNLKLLRILPEQDWNPQAVVTHQQFVEFGEKLINGRGATPIYTGLTANLKTPDGITTYQEALSIAGVLLGYEPALGYTTVKAMTGKLLRNEADQITGYDMAYIFNALLYIPRAGQTKNLLEERYVLGSTSLTSSKILQITADQVVLQKEGPVTLTDDVLAFTLDEAQKLVPVSFGRIAVGMQGLEFALNDAGQLQSVIIREKTYPDLIRVLISKDLSSIGGSNSYDFPEVKVTSAKLFKVIAWAKGKASIIYVAEAGETVTVSNVNGQLQVASTQWSEMIPDRVYFESFYPHEVPLQVLSTKRLGKYPTFAGSFEVLPSAKADHLYLVNELSVEDYLKKVVPSEIPINWGKEAFKVQAVAARSYAISQIEAGRYETQSANVDDSTSSQVYNNCNENKLVNEAIAETTGLIPMYDGSVVDAVFSSTTSGYTASNDEVWNHPDTKAFPGAPTPYLRAKSQIINDTTGRDMTNEETALAFFKDWSLDSFDAISPFYRWTLELTREQLESTINKNLPGRENADTVLAADFIQSISGATLVGNDPAFSIGTLQDLKVVRRGQGGNIMILDVVGSNGTYRIMKEYNVRFVIRPMNSMCGTPADIIIKRYDNSNLRNYSILPSAFVSFEIERNDQNEITKVKFYGGGNGHGVGMSQWGMKGMVDAGYTFDKILKHYYSDMELVKIY